MTRWKPTVYVVDDDQELLDVLNRLVPTLGLEVACYRSAAEFLASYQPRGPGCLVVDVRMPGMSGLRLQEELAQRGIRLPVIILTGYADVPMTAAAMKAGAVDFFEKPFRPHELCEAIQEAVRRDERAWEQQQQHQGAAQRLARLTSGERQVLDLILAGNTNLQIAQQLGLSVRGVEYRRRRLMQKLGATTKRQLLEMFGSSPLR